MSNRQRPTKRKRSLMRVGYVPPFRYEGSTGMAPGGFSQDYSVYALKPLSQLPDPAPYCPPTDDAGHDDVTSLFPAHRELSEIVETPNKDPKVRAVLENHKKVVMKKKQTAGTQNKMAEPYSGAHNRRVLANGETDFRSNTIALGERDKSSNMKKPGATFAPQGETSCHMVGHVTHKVTCRKLTANKEHQTSALSEFVNRVTLKRHDVRQRREKHRMNQDRRQRELSVLNIILKMKAELEVIQQRRDLLTGKSVPKKVYSRGPAEEE